jgi:hypothetical protein
MSNSPSAHYNSSKLCWEILLEEAHGDRMVLVHKEANTAHKMLKEQGIKFVEAKVTRFSNPMLLICDYRFWSDNEEQIFDWCTESRIQCTLTGMILEFNSKEEQMMFMLRWS